MPAVNEGIMPDAKDWEPYLQYARRIFLKRKTVVYYQGTKGDGFYYIKKGKVKIITITAEGKERLLDVEVTGSVFGEQSLDNQPYFSTAVAAEDSILYYFSCKRFNELAASSLSLTTLFVDSVLQKMRLLADDIILKDFSAEQHLAYSLLKISQKLDKYEIPLTQQELSNYTGLTRITVYKILKKWKEDELIAVKNRSFFIKNPEMLKLYMHAS